MSDNVLRIKEVCATSGFLNRPLRSLDQFSAEQALHVKQRAANAGWHALAMSFAELTHKFVNDEGVSGSMSKEDRDEALELLRMAGR